GSGRQAVGCLQARRVVASAHARRGGAVHCRQHPRRRGQVGSNLKRSGAAMNQSLLNGSVDDLCRDTGLRPVPAISGNRKRGFGLFAAACNEHGPEARVTVKRLVQVLLLSLASSLASCTHTSTKTTMTTPNSVSYNIKDFGAVDDGKANSTKQI